MSVRIPGRLKGEGDLLRLTGVRHRELRAGLEKANQAIALALRRGVSQPRREALDRLRLAVDAARQVLDRADIRCP